MIEIFDIYASVKQPFLRLIFHIYKDKVYEININIGQKNMSIHRPCSNFGKRENLSFIPIWGRLNIC